MCGKGKEVNETGRKRVVWREMSRKRGMWERSEMGGNGQIDKREMARGFFLSRA